MLNVCQGCGAYRADKQIDPAGPWAICPECGHRHPFCQLPLFVVCGPSGAGKSTVCARLAGRLSEVVVLDGDLLWRPEFNRPEDNYRDLFETWLRLGKNISQSGRPLLLFLAGATPDNIEPCVERRYFSAIHYLALIAEDAVLTRRLRDRPGWRESGDEAFIADQLRFNRWFRARPATAPPPLRLIDTTDLSVAVTVSQLAAWIKAIL